MTTVLKPSEAMSHGRIMRIKKEESKTINDQINEFFWRGGKIDKVAPGVSGVDNLSILRLLAVRKNRLLCAN